MKNLFGIILALTVASCSSTYKTSERKSASTDGVIEEGVVEQKVETNIALVKKYFNLYQAPNPTEVAGLYAPSQKVVFEDPVFGKLNSVEARVMLQIVLRGGQAVLKISEIDIIKVDKESVQVNWIAEYNSPLVPAGSLAPVRNEIKSIFLIQDGKIVEQQDVFETCSWIMQAMPGATKENCQPAFAKVSAGFKAALAAQMICLKETGKACPAGVK